MADPRRSFLDDPAIVELLDSAEAFAGSPPIALEFRGMMERALARSDIEHDLLTTFWSSTIF